MKVRRFIVSRLRSINQLEWRPQSDRLSGWHVILGDNGAGKSSFLRALSLALIGPREAIAARQEWQEWIAKETNDARITVEITRDASYDTFSGAGRVGDKSSFYAGLTIRRGEDSVTVNRVAFSKYPSADRHLWGTGHGWFSAAYGPFRRFSGGDKDAERIFYSNPRLGAHISIFGESVALTESLLWLRELNYRRLENPFESSLIARLTSFINQPDFLPHDIRLKEVSSRGVEFEDSLGRRSTVEQLSDGFRSILSMTFELIRQLCRVFPENRVFDTNNLKILAPGVVIIDEIDAHLHPSWQKRIGFWLTDHFPNIQFIVSTHSPLVCQAAISGSIFRLASPGSTERSQMLQGRDFDRLVFG